MRVLLSWSGGKDACMCLDTLIKNGDKVVCLLTTASEETGRTFGHDEKREMIKAQAESLQIPVHFIEIDSNKYTESFIEDVHMLKEKYSTEAIAFGDLYMPEHREWGENVAKKTGLKALYPLWMKKEDEKAGLDRFINSDYKAMLIRVLKDLPITNWLGKTLDHKFAEDVSKIGICPMGEAGEYHTFVYDGPLFTKQISITTGEIIEYETTKRIEIQSFSLEEK